MSIRISVVTPCFQSGEFLEGCIHSVADQKYPNFEHIIVDGGSTDDTESIVERNRESISCFISEPDEGMYDAINKGFSRATGDIFCWLNSDDRYLPGALSFVAQVFERFPEIHWITGFPAISTEGVVTSVGDGFFPRELIRLGFCNGRVLPHITQETVFWRRECWEKVGPIPAELKLAGDFWLWRKFAECWELVLVKALLASFSRRPGQLSAVRGAEYEDEVASVVACEVRGDSLRRKRWFIVMSRAWRMLAWIPKVKGLLLRVMGVERFSLPVLSYSLEKGWSFRRSYLGERQSPADRFFERMRFFGPRS